MYDLDWRIGVETWKSVGNSNNIIYLFFLQDGVEDRWKWQLTHDKGYTIRDVCHMLAEDDPVDDLQNVIWHKASSSKVSIFAWHLFRNRLSTKNNLIWCGIIQQNLNVCVSGCGNEEGINHLFMWCVVFGSIRTMVKQLIFWENGEAIDR